MPGDQEIYHLVRRKMRLLRESRHLSQKDVAQSIGLSPQYYYQLEAGSRNPTLQTIESLAKNFNVPRTYFFADDTLQEENIRSILLQAGSSPEDVELILDILTVRMSRRQQEQGEK